MVAGGRIRILTSDQLECIHALQHQAIAHGDASASAGLLVQRCRDSVIGNVLRRVRVEGARINVRAIRSRDGVGIHDALHECPRRGIVCERRALFDRWYEHVAVDLTLVAGLAAIQR